MAMKVTIEVIELIELSNRILLLSVREEMSIDIKKDMIIRKETKSHRNLSLNYAIIVNLVIAYGRRSFHVPN